MVRKIGRKIKQASRRIRRGGRMMLRFCTDQSTRSSPTGGGQSSRVWQLVGLDEQEIVR